MYACSLILWRPIYFSTCRVMVLWFFAIAMVSCSSPCSCWGKLFINTGMPSSSPGWQSVWPQCVLFWIYFITIVNIFVLLVHATGFVASYESIFCTFCLLSPQSLTNWSVVRVFLHRVHQTENRKHACTDLLVWGEIFTPQNCTVPILTFDNLSFLTWHA